jgi:hypothetical protein
LNTTPRDTVRERLYYIDFLAFFTGQVTRRDLVDRFGISEPAATKDLAMYMEMAPNMLQYDVRQRCYTLLNDKPCFEHDVDQALHSLAGGRATSFNIGYSSKISNWIGQSIKRKLDVGLVATLTRAIYQRQLLECVYYSLENGAAAPRILSPLAVIHDGTRWHLRCHSQDKDEFRDYNLSRFLRANVVGRSLKRLEEDNLWNTMFEMELVPHPKAVQQEAIRIDYGIDGDALRISTPVCVTPYFLQHWRVDVTENASRSAAAHHLYLRNRDGAIDIGVPSWIFRAAVQ